MEKLLDKFPFSALSSGRELDVWMDLPFSLVDLFEFGLSPAGKRAEIRGARQKSRTIRHSRDLRNRRQARGPD